MSTTKCEPGAVLTRPVVNERGLTVAGVGVKVSENLLERLHELGIWHIFVEDPRYVGIELVEPLNTETFYTLKGYLRGLIRKVQAGEDDFSERELMEWVEKVSDECAALRKSFMLYPHVGSEEDRWMARIVNVAVLSALTLRRIGGVAQARHLVAAAFLQDLGVWRIDPPLREALWNNRDREAVIQHVRESQRIVTPMRSISSIVKGIVAQHHERLDGSGLPAGRSGNEIHPLAQVIGVVDDYLMLVADAKDPILPHEAIERLMAGVGFEYDHAAVKAFCAAAPVYPVGMEVWLNTGEWAVVVDRSPIASRPVIRILSDENGNTVSPYEIDLSQATTHMIGRIVST